MIRIRLDPSTATTWYWDDDGDTYGTPSTSVVQCAAPSSYVAVDTDCDTNAGIHPGATSINTTDDDCDGDIDDDDMSLDVSTGTLYFADTDADTYGRNKGVMALAPTNHVSNPNDCDDTRGSVCRELPRRVTVLMTIAMVWLMRMRQPALYHAILIGMPMGMATLRSAVTHVQSLVVMYLMTMTVMTVKVRLALSQRFAIQSMMTAMAI